MIPSVSVEDVSTFFEWVLKLTGARSEARKQYLNELLKPAFHAFQEVHEQYLSLFRLTEKALPFRGDVPGNWHYFDELGKPFPVKDPSTQVQALRKRFLEEREKGEYLRDKLRQDTAILLASAPGIEEQRFLFSVTLYFLDDGPIDLSDEFVDSQVQLLISGAKLNSVSSRLALALLRTDDPEQLMTLVKHAHMDTNDRYVTCCRLYRKAEITALGFKADV